MADILQPPPLKDEMLRGKLLSHVWQRWFITDREKTNTKADKIGDGYENNIIIFDAEGNLADSGIDTTQLIILGNTAISADYTITDDDDVQHIQVTTGASDVTITLPTLADNPLRLLYITKVDSGAGEVIIDGEGTETVSGDLTRTIMFQYTTAQLKAGATEWLLI